MLLAAALLATLAGCASDNRGWPRDPTVVRDVDPQIGGPPLVVEEVDEAYASIRIVRAESGPRSRPEILLPEPYRIYDRGNYAVASPGEFYTFLGGPKGVAQNVRIRWPGVEIHSIIHNDTRLAMRRDGDSVLVDIPVQASSLRAAWPTLEVFSHLNERNLPIRIEHNHPARRAGEYARIPWVDGQSQARLNFIFAARQILRDWGIHHQLAEQRAGGISLMGFETNNPLHGDFPAHWHWIYYWPDAGGKASSSAPGSQIPHFYMDPFGRVYENKVDVLGQPSASRRLKAGEPMVYTDPAGQVRMAIEIRPEGGVNIGPAPGQYRYTITAEDDDGDFRQSVRVLRDGEPWLLVAAEDDVDAGVMTVRVRPLGATGEAITEIIEYDPLTGVIQARKP